MSLSPIPDEVLASLQRRVALSARAAAGEYGQVPQAVLDAIADLGSRARSILEMAQKMNEDISLLNEASDGDLESLAAKAASEGNHDLVAQIARVMGSCEGTMREARILMLNEGIVDDIERDLAKLGQLGDEGWR